MNQLAKSAKSPMRYFPNKYFPAEADLLDAANVLFERHQGWLEKPYECLATQEMMHLWANVVDPWNPVFNDAAYALASRHNAMIAAPFFMVHRLLGQTALTLPPTQGMGHWRGLNDGFDVEFFRPVFANDQLKIWREKQSIEDTTAVDGGSARVFSIKATAKFINQNGQPTVQFTTHLRNAFSIDPEAIAALGKWTWPAKARCYSAPDWEKIRLLEDAEVVRGVTPRYWEAVTVGDSITPVVTGPTTVMDMVRFRGLDQMEIPPMRNILRQTNGNGLIKDEMGIYHLFEEAHFASSAGTDGHVIHFQVFGASLMARLLTNYLGDDGWLKTLSCRHADMGSEIIAKIPPLEGLTAGYHPIVSDVIVAKAVVLRKYVEANDHLIELGVWCENFDGDLSQVGIATACLPSKTGMVE